MKRNISTKTAWISSIFSVAICLILLTATTLAWFTAEDSLTAPSIQFDSWSSEAKFAHAFPHTDTYLYRVGNGNTVSLGSLFQEISEDTSIDSTKVTVSVTTVYGYNVTGTYTANTANWKSGTMQFANTGIVKISISESCDATDLYVEVVKGNNVTAYGGFSSGTSYVLLNDIAISSGSTCTITNATLYGNGFTFDLSAGSNSSGPNGILKLYNGTLDHVSLPGAVYETYQSSSSIGTEYNSSTVASYGTSEIVNCYLSDSRAPLRLGDGTLTVRNSVLDGGRYANVDVRGGNLIFDNAVTINEPKAGVAGLGVVIFQECTDATVKGTVKQYNWICEDDSDSFPSDFSGLFNVMFYEAAYQHTYDSVAYVNTGILSLSGTIGDQYVSMNGYTHYDVSYTGVDGHLWTLSDAGYEVSADDMQYRSAVYSFTPKKQGYTKPTFSWAYPDSYDAEAGAVTFAIESGASATLNPHFLAAEKYGDALTVGVSMNGQTYTGDITFTEAGTYEILYTVTDTANYGYDAQVTGDTVTYTKTLKVVVTEIKTTNPPAFTFYYGTNGEEGGTPYLTQPTNSVAGTVVTVGTDKYMMPNVSAVSDGNIGSTTVDGVTIYYPIVDGINVQSGNLSDYNYARHYPIFKAVSISDEATTYDYGSNEPTSMPDTLIWVSATFTDNPPSGGDTKGGNSYDTIDGGKDSPVIKITNDTDHLCAYQVASGEYEYGGTVLVKFSYAAADGNKYYYYVCYKFYDEDESGTCIAAGTMITLADGTQKPIEEVTYNDTLLVWDFFSGTYVETPVALLYYHGESTYPVLTLQFADGRILDVIGTHNFFDADLNEFVALNVNSVTRYVGDRFVVADGNGSYAATELISYTVAEKLTGSYSIVSAVHGNVLANGLFSHSPSPIESKEDFFEYLEVGENMKYDEAQMQADIEQYGLYTYEDLAEYLTYEQFVAVNAPYFKLQVGRGYLTFEDLVSAIKVWVQEPEYVD